jgi:signal transduction histidine kinase
MKTEMVNSAPESRRAALPFLLGRTGKIVFAVSIVLLIVLAFAADHATNLFSESEKSVAHTHEVQTTLARLRTRIYQAQSARLDYVLTGNVNALGLLESSKKGLTGALDLLHSLIADNNSQGERLRLIESLLAQRLALLDESVALRKSRPNDNARQIEITNIGRDMNERISTQFDEMNLEEDRLLAERRARSAQTFERVRGVLAAAFGTVLLILAMDFRRLSIELGNRQAAEAAVRRLSGRVLQLQDAERRKVARELHDSIGQYFASLAMNLELLQNSRLTDAKKGDLLAQSLETVRQGTAETRTLSYLLHPPLLDEAGFASAARWYVDGFAERSNIRLRLEVDPNLGRLSPEVELVLFRVMQECLTNIHRHSGASHAEICVQKNKNVTLTIEDFGKGIPQDLLEEFRTTNTGTGVGLAGMRERVREIGGILNITSAGSGTRVEVIVPVEGIRQPTETSGPSLPEESRSAPKAQEAPSPSGTGGILFGHA